MPNIAVFHPQIVHFVVAGVILGVLFRLISITGKPKFLSVSASILIILGTLAAVAAVKSGTDAHGPVERIPGARNAVQLHEDAGHTARNVLFAVAALELLALGLMKKESVARLVRFGAAAAGIAGAVFVYIASDRGGDLVYEYAGGVGTRSGKPQDVTNLLIAGLYNQAALARKAGRGDEAARLMEEMARQEPDNPDVRYALAQSKLQDAKDPRAALDALNALMVSPDNRGMDMRKGMLVAQAYEQMGQPDSARDALRALLQRYPDNARLKARLDSIK